MQLLCINVCGSRKQMTHQCALTAFKQYRNGCTLICNLIDACFEFSKVKIKSLHEGNVQQYTHAFLNAHTCSIGLATPPSERTFFSHAHERRRRPTTLRKTLSPTFFLSVGAICLGFFLFVDQTIAEARGVRRKETEKFAAHASAMEMHTLTTNSPQGQMFLQCMTRFVLYVCCARSSLFLSRCSSFSSSTACCVLNGFWVSESK